MVESRAPQRRPQGPSAAPGDGLAGSAARATAAVAVATRGLPPPHPLRRCPPFAFRLLLRTFPSVSSASPPANSEPTLTPPTWPADANDGWIDLSLSSHQEFMHGGHVRQKKNEDRDRDSDRDRCGFDGNEMLRIARANRSGKPRSIDHAQMHALLRKEGDRDRWG